MRARNSQRIQVQVPNVGKKATSPRSRTRRGEGDEKEKMKLPGQAAIGGREDRQRSGRAAVRGGERVRGGVTGEEGCRSPLL
jgi:hypothetical protein